MILNGIKSLDIDKDRIPRVKIEQTMISDLPMDGRRYVEVHVLVRDGVNPPTRGWAESRNPRTVKEGKPRFFINRRIYKADGFVDAVEIVRNELRNICYVDFKAEHVLYDPNRDLDSWSA
jgi:hypothetical protein